MATEYKEEYLYTRRKKLYHLLKRIYDQCSVYESSNTLKELYLFLSEIQVTSAIFQMKEIHKICTFLVKRIIIDNNEITFKYEQDSLFFRGIESLLDEMDTTFTKTEVQGYPNEGKSTNILLLDDDLFFVDWLKDEFNESDYLLQTATPHNLIEQLYKMSIDVIIINMSYRESAGYKAVNQIRSEYSQVIPIIALTHSQDESAVLEILSHPVSHVISKPFSTKKLIAYIQNSLAMNEQLMTATPVQNFKVDRQRMEDLIEKEWIRFKRFHSVFSVIVIEISTFEYFIRELGSEYFRTYSQLLQLSLIMVRKYDEVGSWTKGSFIILLPATPLHGATIVANRIKERIEEVQPILGRHVKWGTIQSEAHYTTCDNMLGKLQQSMQHQSTFEKGGVEVPLYREKSSSHMAMKTKLLIIDDDLVSANVLFSNLDSSEWEIEMCTDGNKALEHVLEMKPDLILSETKLNGFDGFSLLIQLKQIPQCEHIKFCFLSKKNDENSVVRAFHFGADDYFFKPYMLKEIEARIRNQVNKGKL